MNSNTFMDHFLNRHLMNTFADCRVGMCSCGTREPCAADGLQDIREDKRDSTIADLACEPKITKKGPVAGFPVTHFESILNFLVHRVSKQNPSQGFRHLLAMAVKLELLIYELLQLSKCGFVVVS